MNRKIFQLFLLVPIFLFGSLSSNAQVKTASVGSWSFEAPDAPEGYTYGILDLKKDSAFMTFSNATSRYPSNWIKVRNDSIIYQTDINGTIVLFSLKIIDKQKIAGNAVWSDGETSMNLIKKED
jgi:hypothetical protein